MVANPLVKGEEHGKVDLRTGAGEEAGGTPQIRLSRFWSMRDHGAEPGGRRHCLHLTNMEKQTSQLLLPFPLSLGAESPHVAA